jgi:hypothetical protein
MSSVAVCQRSKSTLKGAASMKYIDVLGSGSRVLEPANIRFSILICTT